MVEEITVTLGDNKRHGLWTRRKTMSFSELASTLSKSPFGTKDGPCYTPAVFSGEARNLNQAAQIDIAVLDSDCGHTLEEISYAIEQAGYEAIIHSTHSHLTTQTEIKTSAFEKFGGDIQDYMRAKISYLPRVIEGAKIISKSSDGSKIFVRHNPCPKFRIIIPLAKPWLASDFKTQAEANATWRKFITDLALSLGLQADQSCSDTSRLFYFPRTRRGGPEYQFKHIRGNPCDLHAVIGAGAADVHPEPNGQHNPRKNSHPAWLLRWAATCASNFEIVSVLKARSPHKLGRLNGATQTICCPFEDEHTISGGEGTFAVNASEVARAGLPQITSGFILRCSHNACASRDRLDLLSGMLNQGWLTEKDLYPPNDAQKLNRHSGTKFEDVPPQAPRPGIADRIEKAIERGGEPELPNDGRSLVHLSTDLDADLRKCERELILSPHVEVYQRAGCIVRRGTTKGKTHEGEVVVFDRIAHYTVNSLRAVMAKAITFLASDKTASRCHPPKEYARLLLDHPEKNYPILYGLISAPTLRADGSILDKPGYDERTGLFFDPKGEVFCPIPANPTKDDALAALKELLEPIAKFPFVDEASKSVQLARMLTGVCRTALFTSPLFGYTAPSARTGKSMLVDIACILSHGHVAPVVVASSTFEELDKQLQAMVSSGDTIIALDNQDTDEALESNLLCQMLTQPVVKIRPFGQNQDMLDFPSLAVVSVTGNNLAIAKDLTERTLLCSLDAKMEVPGRRKFEFNPVVMVMENRARLVRACLIILRAYVVAGRPAHDIMPMGGFENWSGWVRSALVWLGCDDPCATMDKSGRATRAEVST